MDRVFGFLRACVEARLLSQSKGKSLIIHGSPLCQPPPVITTCQSITQRPVRIRNTFPALEPISMEKRDKGRGGVPMTITRSGIKDFG